MDVTSILWIGEGSLLARFKLEIADGVIIRCNVFQRKDDGIYFAAPAAVRLPGFDGYRNDIEFASKKHLRAWTERALEAFWDCVSWLLSTSEDRVAIRNQMNQAASRCEVHRAKQGYRQQPVPAVVEPPVERPPSELARVTKVTLEEALVAALGGAVTR